MMRGRGGTKRDRKTETERRKTRRERGGGVSEGEKGGGETETDRQTETERGSMRY